MIKSEAAKELLDKFPNTPSLTLAKKLYAENIELFPTVDSARSAIRGLRGSQGERRRKNCSIKTHYRDKPMELNPFDNIPEGITSFDDWAPFVIDGHKTLILADTHIPYHDKKALTTALKFGESRGIDTVILMGDIIDFYSVSFWVKDPRERNIQNELDQWYAIADSIRKAFKKARVIYKIGNHEERLERYLKVKAPELLDLEFLEFSNILKVKDFDFELVSDKRIIKLGKLNVIHGHEFGRTMSSPVNPARGLYLRGKENCIGAHYHQTSSHHEKSMTEDVIGCWSVGCLCDLHPDYLPINKWNHGCAVVTVNEDMFEVDNRTIIDGRLF